MKNMFRYRTSIGIIGIAEENGAITDLWFPQGRNPKDAVEKETELLRETDQQMSDYLRGYRKEFSVPMAPAGTPFMLKVLDSLRTIPYGQTRSYGEIARLIGSPNASRAVGMANHRNPIAILIPCHRVIGTNGKLVGYLGGLDLKKQLLDLEMDRISHPTD